MKVERGRGGEEKKKGGADSQPRCDLSARIIPYKTLRDGIFKAKRFCKILAINTQPMAPRTALGYPPEGCRLASLRRRCTPNFFSSPYALDVDARILHPKSQS